MKPWPWKKSFIQCWQNKLPLKEYPKLTIITPSYNQGRFLEETILSVLNQDYPNLEYIIIDGGSTDNSVEIIKKYEHRLSYWVSEKDNGQTHAINKGLEKATGEIIGWLNSDDVYLPWTFRNAIKTFNQNPDVSLVWGSRILLGAHSEVLGFSFANEFKPETMSFCINSETAFWRASVHEKIGRLNEELRFAMDIDFFTRIFKNFQSVPMPQFQGCFRCYADNKSSTMQDVCLEEAIILWRKHFGIDYCPPKPQVNKGIKLSALRLLLYPFTAVFPYLKTRLSRNKAQ